MAAVADAAAVKKPAPPAPIIMHCDMPAEVRDEVLAAAAAAATAHDAEKDQAQAIKKAMEASDGGLWHVVVGKGFGASVAHSNSMLLHFRLGKVHYLVFQSFDETTIVTGATTHVARGAGKKKADDDEDAE